MFSRLQRAPAVRGGRLTIDRVGVGRLNDDIGRNLSDDSLVLRVCAAIRPFGEGPLFCRGLAQQARVNPARGNHRSEVKIRHGDEVQSKPQFGGKAVIALGHQPGERATDVAKADQ